MILREDVKHPSMNFVDFSMVLHIVQFMDFVVNMCLIKFFDKNVLHVLPIHIVFELATSQEKGHITTSSLVSFTCM
jgi:hypothetical protein